MHLRGKLGQEWLHVVSSQKLTDGFAEDVGGELIRIVEAARVQPLNRYNIRPGRIFGSPTRKERYKVLDITSNSVVYKNLTTDKVESAKIDDIVQKWNLDGIYELSPVEEILQKIKSLLTPFLGGILVAALMSWLNKKLS